MNEGKRAKGKRCSVALALTASSFSLSLPFPSFIFHLAPHLSFLHHFILFTSPFLLGVQAPRQVRDLAEELPNWATDTAP